ncbi:hypothetical protein F320042A7_02850 [Blautia producta]|uniref:Transposase domain-containing protein n=1 Tax=Blautia producta ATCC 27340 = DSM 2950 TaxID=1121114 RepID=A0ABX6JDK3_9FIRM|nr:transposase domain-containing protein [Blautia producta]QIB56292.1 transposase domain-containing protein [Blautia producta ATCC 27340 = DSM 2950]
MNVSTKTKATLPEKPFDYVQYLLEEIPQHMDDTDCSFIEELLPWSEKLPAEIRKA